MTKKQIFNRFLIFVMMVAVPTALATFFKWYVPMIYVLSCGLYLHCSYVYDKIKLKGDGK